MILFELKDSSLFYRDCFVTQEQVILLRFDLRYRFSILDQRHKSNR